MAWHDLFFLHWPVSADQLQPLLPHGLLVDTLDGIAYVGVVPFVMSHVAPLGLPTVPGLSFFPELNVRTYVRPAAGGPLGVYFFSLDAHQLLAVWLARTFFHLPYFRADMDWDGAHYKSLRQTGAAEFTALYGEIGAVKQPDWLADFLTARYCFYTANRRSQILVGNVHHRPWTLHDASITLTKNTMISAAGIDVPDPLKPAHVMFSKRLDVVAWPVKRWKLARPDYAQETVRALDGTRETE